MRREVGYLSLTLLIISMAALCGMAPNRTKTPGLKLLFHELLFGLPTDQFFIVEFFPATGGSHLLKRVSAPRVFNVLEKRESVPWSSDAGHFGVRYVRRDLEGKNYDFYECVLLSKQKHEIFKNLGVGESKPLFLKQEAFWKELDSLLGTSTETTSSFIRLRERGFLLFRSHGTYVDLVRIVDGKQTVLRRINGIVSESGRVNEDWGWFCQRTHPKSEGRLIFIHLNTGRLVKNVQSKAQCKLITVLTENEASSLVSGGK